MRVICLFAIVFSFWRNIAQLSLYVMLFFFFLIRFFFNCWVLRIFIYSKLLSLFEYVVWKYFIPICGLFFSSKNKYRKQDVLYKTTFISHPSSYFLHHPISDHLKVMAYPSIVYLNMSNVYFEYLVEFVFNLYLYISLFI